MEKKNISLTFCAKIVPFEKINDQFTRCKCYVQALGKNRNLTYFSKESVDRALPTIFNIPVIGHIIEAEDGHRFMGGHDAEVVADDKGNLSLRSICVPYGVVPQQDNVGYETLIEPDGVAREYLKVDIILWTGRFPELKDAVYSDNFYFNQSMEIVAMSWKPLEDDHNYLDVVDYQYSALCLLGKADDTSSMEHTEPCFPLASVQPYEYNMQSDSFIGMVSQLREELASCFAQTESQKGGNAEGMSKEMFNAILDEFGLTADQIDIEMSEDMTEEEFRTAVQEFVNNNIETAGDNATESAEPTGEDFSAESNDDNGEQQDDGGNVEEFALTARAAEDMLRNMLHAASVRIENEDGRTISETEYHLVDFDDKYVYCDRRIWTDGFPDSLFAYCRVPYVFNESSREMEIAGGFEEMVVQWLTLEEAAEIERKRQEYEELRGYRAWKEVEELHSAMDDVLNDFADIENTEEFASIRNDPYQFATVEELRTACFAARGMVAQPKQKATGVCRQPIVNNYSNENSNSRYGDLFDRFGRKDN